MQEISQNLAAMRGYVVRSSGSMPLSRMMRGSETAVYAVCPRDFSILSKQSSDQCGRAALHG